MSSGPPSEPRTWHYGLVARWWAEFHHGGPEILPEWRAGSDGADYRFRSRTLEVDPLAQRLTMEVQASRRRGGEVLRDEMYLLATTMYTANHLELMLSVAGFEDIDLRGDWTDEDPTPDTTTVVFLARKPA
jgi:hypothetical protein